jgi:hypothetical protein
LPQKLSINTYPTMFWPPLTPPAPTSPTPAMSIVVNWPELQAIFHFLVFFHAHLSLLLPLSPLPLANSCYWFKKLGTSSSGKFSLLLTRLIVVYSLCSWSNPMFLWLNSLQCICIFKHKYRLVHTYILVCFKCVWTCRCKNLCCGLDISAPQIHFLKVWTPTDGVWIMRSLTLSTNSSIDEFIVEWPAKRWGLRRAFKGHILPVALCSPSASCPPFSEQLCSIPGCLPCVLPHRKPRNKSAK